MGLLGFLSNVPEAIRETAHQHKVRVLTEENRRMYEIAEQETTHALLEWELNRVTDIQRFVQRDEDESDWMLTGPNANKNIIWTEEYRRELVQKARQQAITRVYAKSVLRNLCKYVLGSGIVVTLGEEDSPSQKWWDTYAKDSRFVRTVSEMLLRTFRDGECLIVWRNSPMVGLRFLDPLRIKEPDEKAIRFYDKQFGEHSYGIHHDPEDYETVYGYWFATEKDGTTTWQYLDASQVEFIRINCDADQLRGRPHLEPMIDEIEMARKFSRDRGAVHHTQSLFALHKKIRGAVSGQLPKALPTRSVATEDTNRTIREGISRPGSIITTNDSVELLPLSPNVHAADAANDKRGITLDIAAGAGLAEFQISADASNANYASTLVAEAPAVKEIEEWQRFFGEILERIVGRIVNESQRTGFATVGDAEVKIAWPPVVTRNEEQTANANQKAIQDAYMSRRTAAERLDLDYDDEKERIEEERRDLVDDGLNAALKQATQGPLADIMKTMNGDKDDDNDSADRGGSKGRTESPERRVK